MLNNRPPTGAPNAEDTPAATPAEIKFLLEVIIDAELQIIRIKLAKLILSK